MEDNKIKWSNVAALTPPPTLSSKGSVNKALSEFTHFSMSAWKYVLVGRRWVPWLPSQVKENSVSQRKRYRCQSVKPWVVLWPPHIPEIPNTRLIEAWGGDFLQEPEVEAPRQLGEAGLGPRVNQDAGLFIWQNEVHTESYIESNHEPWFLSQTLHASPTLSPASGNPVPCDLSTIQYFGWLAAGWRLFQLLCDGYTPFRRRLTVPG